MSTNKIIDVWNENGYMMQSCLDYEEAYLQASGFLESLIVLNTLDGSVTLTPSGIERLGKAISELLTSSKRAIDEKSECMHRLKRQEKSNEKKD